MKLKWVKIFAGLFVIALTGVIFYQLRTAFLTFDTVEVQLRLANAQDERAAQVDKILLDNIKRKNELREFEHILAAEEKKINVGFKRADQCEVTQKEFQLFVNWVRNHRRDNITVAGQPLQWKYTSNTMSHAISGKLNAAVTGVTFYDAHAYCKAAGGRLPTTDEMIALASGREGRLYPWGNKMNETAWPYLDPILNATQKCGIHKKNSTPEGLFQLGHGVSEWAHNTNLITRPSIHGGNAFNRPLALYALSNMYRYAPLRYRSPYLGFRCVYENDKVRATPWRTPVRAAKVPGKGYLVGMPANARVGKLMMNLKPNTFRLIDELFGESDGEVARSLKVMRKEVTRAQYQTFLRDPMVHFGFYADDNQPRGHSYQPDNWKQQLEQPDLPVTGIDWWSAYAFALWSGGRLPTASEWTTLASDSGRTIYPWGNEYIPGGAVTGETTLTHPQVAGTALNDKTKAGLWDMAGNVSEWTRSVAITSVGYGVIIKGGNFMLPGKETTRIDFSNHIPPNHRAPAIGFRVVFDN